MMFTAHNQCTHPLNVSFLIRVLSDKDKSFVLFQIMFTGLRKVNGNNTLEIVLLMGAGIISNQAFYTFF